MAREEDGRVKKARVTAKAYLVGIPIAALDAGGERLPRELLDAWANRVARALTEWFGGATVLPAPGASEVLKGESEGGQRLVLAACDSREAFLRHRSQVMALAEDARVALSQESVLVLAFDSDSFLVEDAEPPLET